MKDCTTCKYGYEDERLGIPMCHHPKRFSEDCVDSDFRMYEEKETKESEKPVPADLEEAARKYKEGVPVDTIIYYCGTDEDVYFSNRIVDAFIAGAKWQKEQDEKEQADLFTIVALDAAQRAKNKMMEDAKEGKIIFLLNGDVAVNIGDTDEYKLGQKVRIIILPKED